MQSNPSLVCWCMCFFVFCPKVCFSSDLTHNRRNKKIPVPPWSYNQPFSISRHLIGLLRWTQGCFKDVHCWPTCDISGYFSAGFTPTYCTCSPPPAPNTGRTIILGFHCNTDYNLFTPNCLLQGAAGIFLEGQKQKHTVHYFCYKVVLKVSVAAGSISWTLAGVRCSLGGYHIHFRGGDMQHMRALTAKCGVMGNVG